VGDCKTNIYKIADWLTGSTRDVTGCDFSVMFPHATYRSTLFQKQSH
jgi:hypothetical protein